MRKWSIGVAMAVLCAGGGSAVWAQGYTPSQGVPSTDPAPYAPAQDYGLQQMGPGGSGAACPFPTPTAQPLMPPLPGNTPNVSTPEVREPEACCWYADIGALWLMRQRLGNTILAVQDPQSLDTGAAPPANAPVLAHFGNFDPDFETGVQATLGYKWDGCAIELTGYYIPKQASGRDVVDAGRIDSFFYNPPLGFEGDNGLWRQADIMQVRNSNELGNVELNARWWSHNYFTDWELITGVRYLDIIDDMSIFTDDDGLLIRAANGLPDPTRQALYSSNAHDHITAGQLGLRWCGQCCSWMTLGVCGKFAVGPNFASTDVSLVRGDGYVGFDSHSTHTSISEIYDLSTYLTFHPWDGVYVRAGYNTLWATNIAEGQGQVDFNLQDHTGKQNWKGSIFYNGPFLQFELFF